MVLDTGSLGTIANFDDVTPFLYIPVVFVYLRRRSGDCGQGRSYRSKQAENKG